MTNKKTGRVTRSETTRALISEKAKQRGAARSDAFRDQVRATMRLIEQEMGANEGIYPHNKGALSLAELARRADVHQTTLFSAKQREFGVEVKEWLDRVKTEQVVGRGPVRREMSSRVADWKRLYDGLAQAHRDTELALQQAQAELESSQGQCETLRKENVRLRGQQAEAAKTKVVPLRPKKD